MLIDMRKILSICLLSVPLVSSAAHAAPIFLTVEPLVGYERVQKILPTEHTTSRLMYGARLTFGFPLLSLESEYTRGSDSETFSNPEQTLKDTDDKVKLGLRSSIRLSSIFSLQARGGGQAKRNTHEVTQNGTTTSTTSPIVYRPYAGAGLSATLASRFVLTGGITAVFNDFPNMSKNEYQTTLGFSIKFY
jgi:hypothetical protein